ncbi:MAG TPA: spore germination protein, partial [Clostridia bacterium]
GYEKRSVEKPITENVVMGSQEGFTEDLRTNLSLIRRIIKNKNLITEMIKVGKTNQAYVSIVYINGIVNQELVKEVKKRLKSINKDFIIGSGMVGQYIEDNPFMLFPQVLSTERPDRVASFLMDGKVAIITEGTPFAEIVPITFYYLIQTSEDAMLRWQYGTFLRLIRILGVFVSVLLPALYIALALFHQEMIPTELLASIARSKENVPFPKVVEILLLEISFELIREGGIRIPGVIGQTLGIIGALILGQAAVAAGLVSPILIIIVAVTGLGSFAVPNYSFALGLRVIRFFFFFLASILGFYGISLGLVLVACIMCSTKSFGVPFFSPVAPKTKSTGDLIVRQPVWSQENRQDYLNVPNRKKQSNNVRGWKNNKGGQNI